MSSALVSKPTLIEAHLLSSGSKLKFLIMDAPKDNNLHHYIKECKKYNVANIARISEPTYNKEEVEKAGISLHELYFHDGASPPLDVISKWMDLVDDVFDDNRRSKQENPCIAVHCVAGLGRAPVLVAIALIEYGMDAASAVTFIRDRRRGAINAAQLMYLESYKPIRRKQRKACCVM